MPNSIQALTQNMDHAVAEVFELMLDRSCAATQQGSAIDTDITARICFSGTLKGQCIIGFPSVSAQRLTSAFLESGQAVWDDSMVADAVGELCNMIAGGWKKRRGASAWGADLSVPSITLGSNPEAPDHRTASMRRAYAFDNSPFVVILTIC